MRKKTLRVSDLRAGLAEADRRIEQTQRPAFVASSSGRPLAVISVVVGAGNVPENAIAVDGEVFRQRRTTIVYGASLGLIFVVQQKEKFFVISPPPDPDHLLPRPFEASRAERRDHGGRGVVDEVRDGMDAIAARVDAVAVKVDALSAAGGERLADEVKRRVEGEARIEELLRRIGALEERLQIANLTPTESKRSPSAA